MISDLLVESENHLGDDLVQHTNTTCGGLGNTDFFSRLSTMVFTVKLSTDDQGHSCDIWRHLKRANRTEIYFEEEKQQTIF